MCLFECLTLLVFLPLSALIINKEAKERREKTEVSAVVDDSIVGTTLVVAFPSGGSLLDTTQFVL